MAWLRKIKGDLSSDPFPVYSEQWRMSSLRVTFSAQRIKLAQDIGFPGLNQDLS
jgi:hypothetical protein